MGPAAAPVLRFAPDSLEIALSSLRNDPPVVDGEPPFAARLQLSQALKRARLAIAWERFWPNLARVLCVAGLFLAVSWAGLWLALSLSGRIIGLIAFAALTIAALTPFARLRWPTRDEALLRLDRKSGIKHRPATELSDSINSSDPVAQALWAEQRNRTLAAVKSIRAGNPSPRLALHDPRALRALVVVGLVATFFAAEGERSMRFLAAFDLHGFLTPVNVRVDAWVTAPAYTGKPPVILLSSAAREGSAAQPQADKSVLQVPAGSVLIIRSSGRSGPEIGVTGGVSETPSAEQAPQGASERRFTIATDGTAQLRSPGVHWTFVAQPDRAPSIELAKDPERQARGSLLTAYRIEDDYGVTEAHARFKVKPPTEVTSGKSVRPLFEPPGFQLVLPNARTRAGVGQTVKDLTEDPYAGADVTLTLTAKDESGNEGSSEPFGMRLPERLFTKPVARALIEQRRDLALDANRRSLVHAALEALAIAPDQFMPQLGHYLGLRSVTGQLAAARNDDALREVVASLWALAVTIEDGNISDVEKALRAAQEALKQALERGASDEEIRKLTDQLRAALDNFMRQLAEQLQKNPQQLARPLDQNSKVLRQQDLNNMIERMERLSRSGDKDAAKQLLEQLQQMLENLQMARPGQGGDDDEMQQSMNELGDVIRKQQQLRDRTFKQGQDSRRDRQRGQQGDKNALGDLQQDQQALRDRLRKLQEQLARQGMGQGPKSEKGEKGQRGQQGQQGQPGDDGDGDGDALADAGEAMGDADGQLGDGNSEGAVGSQGKALEALRKGAQKLAQAMQQQMGEGQDDGNPGPGDRRGRAQRSGPNTDPLGRPLRGREFNDDFTVKIPGEIDVQRVRRILEELRRRLADPARPQIELDYIERLLKDY